MTLTQRYQFHACLQHGLSLSRTAEQLSLDRRTLARERVRCPGEYDPEQAQRHRHQARSERGAYKLRGLLKARLEHLLANEFSPEQAVGRMALEGAPTVSASTAYRHIYADALDGGQLYTHTRSGRRKPRKRLGKPTLRGILRGRRPLSERPELVDRLERTGDLEVDTIVGTPRKGALITAVDRVSLHTWIAQTPDGSRRSQPVAHVLSARLRPVRERIHTITSDNGKEFAEHQAVAKSLKADWFFADPYCTNQRARVENTNALIRQYLPKGNDLRLVGGKEIRSICAKLNHRPRKKLGYRTPHEVFFETTETLIT
jgi:IS30 family transposase